MCVSIQGVLLRAVSSKNKSWKERKESSWRLKLLREIYEMQHPNRELTPLSETASGIDYSHLDNFATFSHNDNFHAPRLGKHLTVLLWKYNIILNSPPTFALSTIVYGFRKK